MRSRLGCRAAMYAAKSASRSVVPTSIVAPTPVSTASCTVLTILPSSTPVVVSDPSDGVSVARIPTGGVVAARRSPLRSRDSALPDRARIPATPARVPGHDQDAKPPDGLHLPGAGARENRGVLDLLISLALLVVGAALLTAGAEGFAENVTAASSRLGVSVLALALLLAGAEPEEAVTAMLASGQGHPALAAGDAIGANLVILTLTLGLAALLTRLPVTRRGLEYAGASAVLGAVAWLFLLNGVLGRLEGGDPGAAVRRGRGVGLAAGEGAAADRRDGRARRQGRAPPVGRHRRGDRPGAAAGAARAARHGRGRVPRGPRRRGARGRAGHRRVGHRA